MAIGEIATKTPQWSDAKFGQDFSLTFLISKAFTCLVQKMCINRHVIGGGLVFNFSHQKHLGPSIWAHIVSAKQPA